MGAKNPMFHTGLSEQYAKDLAKAMGIDPRNKQALEKVRNSLDKVVDNLTDTSGEYEAILKELTKQLDRYNTKGFQPKSMKELEGLKKELTQITATMNKLANNKDVSVDALAALSPLMIKVSNSVAAIKQGEWGKIALADILEKQGLGGKVDPKGIERLYAANTALLNKDFKKFMRDNNSLLKKTGIAQAATKTILAGFLGPASPMAESLYEMLDLEEKLFSNDKKEAKARADADRKILEALKEQEAEDKRQYEEKKAEEKRQYDLDKDERRAQWIKEIEEHERIATNQAYQQAVELADLMESQGASETATLYREMAEKQRATSNATQAEQFRQYNAFAMGSEGIDASSAEEFIRESKREKDKMFKIEKKSRDYLEEIADNTSVLPILLGAIAGVAAKGGMGGGDTTVIPPVGPSVPGGPKGSGKWDKLKDLAKKGLEKGKGAVRWVAMTPQGRLAATAAAVGVSTYQASTNPSGQNYIDDLFGGKEGVVRGTAKQSVANVSSGYEKTKEFFSDTTGQTTVGDILHRAAAATGTDYNTLAAFAYLESGLGKNLQTPGQSAKGLFQFMPETWNWMVGNFGKKYGIEQGDIMDIEANAIMGAELMKLSANALTKRGHAVDATSLYLTHFLGTGGGPHFLDNLRKKPDAPAAPDFPEESAEKGNKPLFFADRGKGRALTYREMYNLMQGKTAGAAKAGQIAMTRRVATGRAAGGGSAATMMGIDATMLPPSAEGSANAPAANQRATPAPSTPSSGVPVDTALNLNGTSNATDFSPNISIDTIPMYVDDAGLILVSMGGMI